MSKSVRAEAIEKLKLIQNPRTLLILEQDQQLQLTLAGWEFIKFELGRGRTKALAEDAPPTELVDAAWDQASYDADQLNELFGVQRLPSDKVGQAAALGLGYPDGTIHPLVEQFLAAKVQASIRNLTKRPKQGG